MVYYIINGILESTKHSSVILFVLMCINVHACICIGNFWKATSNCKVGKEKDVLFVLFYFALYPFLRFEVFP